MLAAVDSIIHELEAMRAQLEFLKQYATKWKFASVQKESDKASTQLILATYYLKEGLEDLYGQETNFMQSKLGFSTADEINIKHKAVMNSLDRICRSLVDLSSKMLPLNKEYISESINGFCQLITVLSVQENEIFQSYIN
jgi:hypothetical protein